MVEAMPTEKSEKFSFLYDIFRSIIQHLEVKSAQAQASICLEKVDVMLNDKLTKFVESLLGERDIVKKTNMLVVLKSMAIHAPALRKALDRRIDEDIMTRLTKEKRGALDIMKIGEELKVQNTTFSLNSHFAYRERM